MGNGITERMNKTFLDKLGYLDPRKKQDWKGEIASLVRAYNCTRHETTDYTPELAIAKSRASQKHQKDNYDKRIRGAVVQPCDRVLMRVVSSGCKHKIADKWENDGYIVVGQPVYVVKKENGSGVKRTLHRNLLLLIVFLSGDHISAVPENVTHNPPPSP